MGCSPHGFSSMGSEDGMVGSLPFDCQIWMLDGRLIGCNPTPYHRNMAAAGG